MRRYLRKLVFVLYVVVACLVAGEAVVRLFYPRFQNYNMEMWRYASDMKLSLEKSRLPFHHYPNKRGDYYGAEIRTNSLGFRDYEYDYTKPADTKRIVFLGDSFTLGWGVPLEQTFAKRLEQMLNQTEDRCEVINMGIGNYNSIMEVELFKWKGLSLDPDMVVLMFFLNDTEPIPRQKSVVTYAIVKHSYFLSFLFDRFVRLRSRYAETFEWSSYYRGLYSQDNAGNLAENSGAVRGLIELCEREGIGLLIVNIPELHSFKDYSFYYATDYIKDLAEEAGTSFLDLLPRLASYEPESMWVSMEDTHANSRAHGLIAEEIYGKILRDALLE